jgi:hypothetical protein
MKVKVQTRKAVRTNKKYAISREDLENLIYDKLGIVKENYLSDQLDLEFSSNSSQFVDSVSEVIVTVTKTTVESGEQEY